MTDDAILDQLRVRAESMQPRSDGVPKLHPPATRSQIEAAEGALGLSLPPLLHRIYLEIGNGGCMLGPGFGVIGLPGGYDNDGIGDLVKLTLETAEEFEWWDDCVIICSWGCNTMSCIDCSDEDFSVFQFDANHIGDSEMDDEPPDYAWNLESDTFAEWVLSRNCRDESTD